MLSINEILSDHGLEFIEENGCEYLSGSFFAGIDIRRGLLFTHFPYAVAYNKEKLLQLLNEDVGVLLEDVKTTFIRECNLGYLPGEKIEKPPITPKNIRIAEKMFSKSETWAFADVEKLFPAFYVGWKQVSGEDIIIAKTSTGVEFEIPREFVYPLNF